MCAEGSGDKDWLFDYLMSVFRSPQWDASVMGFIDENCAVFDAEEENKFSYTELHKQFRELVSDHETLVSVPSPLCPGSLAGTSAQGTPGAAQHSTWEQPAAAGPS